MADRPSYRDLRLALEKYGIHEMECSYHWNNDRCDCGLWDLIENAKPSAEQLIREVKP